MISIGTIGLMKAVDTFDSDPPGHDFRLTPVDALRMSFGCTSGGSAKPAPPSRSKKRWKPEKSDSALTLADVLQDGFCMEESCERQEDAQPPPPACIEGLPARERTASIMLRYGLAGQPPLTQLETAKLLQISRSYVSRLETHALELLRAGWEQD